MFRHNLERTIQYLMILILVVELLFVNVWRVCSLTAGGGLASDVFREAFPGVTDLHPDDNVILLLTGCVLFLAVVAEMRFRRIIWICIITFLVFAITVIYFKLPRTRYAIDAKQIPVLTAAPQDVSARLNKGVFIGLDVGTGAVVSAPLPKDLQPIVEESPDSMQNWLLALQLAVMYLISMFGKVQLELLQRQNFLELELAQKRIDVLEKTIEAIDSKNNPHSHIEETHKRIKNAERIIEKMKLMKASIHSTSHMQELDVILEVLRETEKTVTIMDFQKEVLIGPIKTGVEYKEEEVVDWLHRVFGPAPEVNEPISYALPSMPSLVPISSIQTGGGDLDLGISAKSLMKKLGVDWYLDPLELQHTLQANHATDMNAFCLTARALMSPYLHNVLLGITPEILTGFAKAMNNAYLDVPYHNSEHGAMVAHHACVLLELTGLRAFLGGMDRLALIVAALGHSVSHFGRTNSFLIETRHELAQRYNDMSVLENFHASRTFEIIRSSKQTNFLATMSKKDEKRFRNRVVQLILATDTSHHFTHLSELRMRLLNFTKMFEDPEVIESDKRIGLISVVMAADMGFFAASIDVHSTWMDRMLQELAQQGDDEKALGLTVSPMCDRQTQEIESIAVGMIKLLAIPMFNEIANLVRKLNPGEAEASLDTIRESINTNQAYWEGKKRGPRSHLGSFDMFIPVPKERTITGSSDANVTGSDHDSDSIPSLIPFDSPISMTRFNTRHSDTVVEPVPEEDEEDDSEDDGPPILPFSAVHRP